MGMKKMNLPMMGITKDMMGMVSMVMDRKLRMDTLKDTSWTNSIKTSIKVNHKHLRTKQKIMMGKFVTLKQWKNQKSLMELCLMVRISN